MPQIDWQTVWKYYHEATYVGSQLPRVGPWFVRADKVQRILATPCSTTPQLWVEAAFSAAPRLVYLKTKPFIQAEVAYRFFNNRCGKKKGRGIIRRFANALNIQDPDVVVNTKITGVTRAVFTIAGDFALKAEWYLMIVDRVTEFAYNFVSLPYQWAGCPVAGEPHLDAGQNGYQFASGGSIFTGWDTIDANEFFIAGGVLNVTRGTSVSVSYSISSMPAPLNHEQAVTIQTQLMGSAEGALEPIQTSTAQPDGSQFVAGGYLYDGRPNPGSEYWVACWQQTVGPEVAYTQGSFRAYGSHTGSVGLNFDPP
jgi:hypothetical protein